MGNNTKLESARELTAILRRYPHLPRRWVQALSRSPEYARKWLSQNRGTLVTNHKDSFSARLPVKGSRYPRLREFCWMLTPSGRAVNGDNGYDFVPPGGHFKHQLASSFVAASFELATRDVHGLKLITPEHILLHHRCPDETRNSKKPWLVKTPKIEFEADAPVFGLRYYDSEIYFHGFELDRSSESLSIVAAKLAQYQTYLDLKLSKKLYGIKEIYFPWIVRDAERMNNIKTKIKDEIASEYQHLFILNVQPETVDFPEPSGRMVRDEWHTTDGHFNILAHLKEKADGRRETLGETDRAEATA